MYGTVYMLTAFCNQWSSLLVVIGYRSKGRGHSENRTVFVTTDRKLTLSQVIYRLVAPILMKFMRAPPF